MREGEKERKIEREKEIAGERERGGRERDTERGEMERERGMER